MNIGVFGALESGDLKHFRRANILKSEVCIYVCTYLRLQ